MNVKQIQEYVVIEIAMTKDIHNYCNTDYTN